MLIYPYVEGNAPVIHKIYESRFSAVILQGCVPFRGFQAEHRVVTNAAPQVASARQAIDFAKRSQSERDSRIPRCLPFWD